MSWLADAGDDRRVGLGVIDDELDLLAEDAACVVDLLGLQLGAVERRSVERGQRARHVERRADLDGVCLRARPSRRQEPQPAASNAPRQTRLVAFMAVLLCLVSAFAILIRPERELSDRP